MVDKNKYGQYMTPEVIVDFMISLSKVDSSSKILEPSSGEGIFIKKLKERGLKNITAYEIDKEIINPNDDVKNWSFLSDDIRNEYDLVIGNPPYIRRKNMEEELREELDNDPLWNTYCNSLCDYSAIFIIKAIEALKEGGELIFITPEYWMNTTHSKGLRNYMLDKGYVEEIYHFNETPIFDKVTVSTIIFKFIKSSRKEDKKIKVVKYHRNKKLTKDVLANLKNNIDQEDAEFLEIPRFQKDKNWKIAPPEIITELEVFESKCRDKTSGRMDRVGDFCDIGNGMVSGLDKIFQVNGMITNDFENKHMIKVIKAKDLIPYVYNDTTDYIFVNNIQTEEELKNLAPNFYEHFQDSKEKLNKRYQYNRKINYWEWVFLRNFEMFNKKIDRIFVPCKERISNKDYFRFSLVEGGIFPTQDVTGIFKKNETKESLYYILAILNSKYVFDWLRFNGVVKGSIVEFSEKPISSIPYRKIDFNNEFEKELHNKISNLTKLYIENRENGIKERLNKEVALLFIQ